MTICSVDSICSSICSGGTPKSGVSSYYANGTIPWLNTKEVNFRSIRKTANHITHAGLVSSSAKWVNRHTVIIAMYGATAGKAAITEIPLTTNQACCNLSINPDKADYRYIYYWFKNNFQSISSLANGGAQQNLNAKSIRELLIDLPSLDDQARVSAVLSSLDRKMELNNRINDYLAA